MIYPRKMAEYDDDPQNDSRFLRLAQAILRGEPYEELEFGVSKMLNFVLARDGSDTWITPSIIRIRFVGRPTIHPYIVDAAPGVVWDLMGRMGLDRIVEPTVGVARVARGRLRHWPGSARTDMIGWVIPEVDAIVIYTRPVTGELCTTGPIPAEGPWMLPAPRPPWDPPPRKSSRPEHVALPEPLACPHCGAPSTTYRKLTDGFFVCPACSRSFEPGR